ncbi:YtxH domain-containing protein [Streptococcus didelphis]|uniref:YtxH domain-containing protein n=1 Tax=Streptococcus didelphis TaxID=102886 RepID=A0ABY9LHB9_9STRE|nr:hypothetical protein [Streptococcus didelphis]WMB28265.1 YtxH domain-containing protein [Streptococcus didelphis]WMB28939.1 YtxH domain-containing protein [Streptococcus didelphis]
MNSKKKGLLIGLAVGSLAATIAYLSLADNDKKEIIDDSSQKLDDLIGSLKSMSDSLVNLASDKLEDSKDSLTHYSERAGQSVGETFDKVKNKVEDYSTSANKTINEKLNQLHDGSDS